MPKSVTNLVDLETRILGIRGLSVLLDTDLAQLYGVSTKVLLQSVKRNAARFPPDLVFVLSDQEVTVLRSQIVTSKPRNAGWTSAARINHQQLAGVDATTQRTTWIPASHP